MALGSSLVIVWTLVLPAVFYPQILYLHLILYLVQKHVGDLRLPSSLSFRIKIVV